MGNAIYKCMPPGKVVVHYWPFLGRNVVHIRMLEYTKTPYENNSDLGSLMSLQSGTSDVLAPPFVEIDGKTVSQSLASTVFLGKRLGLVPMTGFDEDKALQYMMDVLDTLCAYYKPRCLLARASPAHTIGAALRSRRSNAS